ncbi:hypothetical protein F4809DRAFT_610161 [Biscogniauxia mediterranea]|nr:hypothetical protein F4809DRAFT_610161 [Biscogniauxia mediterranea]
MAPIQNTFSIIPNALSANPADSRPSKRPMTTKQAKKAYREANKGPKLSKAERRRQELFEQDRIRKELEKERNQARARAARDKKKEKEEQERAERKKKGLPLVDVRASQDTIARFIRTTAKTKKPSEQQPSRQSPTPEKSETQDHVPKLPTLPAEREDDASSTCSSSTAEERPEPPAKRQRLGRPTPDEGVKGPLPLSSSSSSYSAPRSQRRVSGGIKPPPPPPSPPSLPSINTKQARGRSHEGSPAVKSIAKRLVEKVEVVASNLHEEQGVDKHEKAVKPKAYIPPGDLPQPRPPEPCSSHVAGKTALVKAQPAVKGYKARSTPTPQPLRDISTEEINARNVKTSGEPTVPPRKPDTVSQSAINPHTETPWKSQTSAPTPQAFRHPKTAMLPPPIPPKFKSPKPTPAGGSRTPQFLKPISKPQTTTESTQHSTTLHRQDERPPSSTQLFMFNHLDDFFPSPSQEVRELFDQPKTSPARNCGQTKPNRPGTVVPSLARRLSTHPAHQKVSTPTIGPKQPATPMAQVQGRKYQVKGPSLSDLSHNPAPATITKPPSNLDIFDIPFFSTQDFCLSSQDMKDIEDESSSSLPKDKTSSTPTLPGNNFRNSNTGPHTPTVYNALPRPSARPIKDLDPIYDDFSNLELLSKPKRDTNRLAPTRPSMKHTQPSHCSSTKRPTLPSQNTRSVRHDKAPLPAQSNPTKSIGKPSFTSKQPGNISNTEASSLQMPAPSSGRVQHQPSNDNSAAAPRPSPKPFLTSGSREMRYKYAIERSKTSAWEDAKARRRAQEELDQLQALEDARLLELLADTGGDNGDLVDKGSQQADKRDTGPADPAKGSTQPGGQGKPPTAGASPPPPPPPPKQRTTITSDATRNDKRNEKPRPPNRRQQSSYEQMLELLKRAQSPQQKQQNQQNQQNHQQSPQPQQKQKQKQRDASPETDYEDAWDDDLCDIL